MNRNYRKFRKWLNRLGRFMSEYGIVVCALGLFLLLFWITSEGFMREPWSQWKDLREAMGQFGDSFGGIINPIFGFLTIFLLVTELRATRQAAKEARIAQEKTEKALRDQLLEAESQNNFVSYYKHLEEFTNYMGTTVMVKINERRLYHIIFSKSDEGSFNSDPEVVRNFLIYRNTIGNLLKKLDTKDIDTVLNVLVGTYQIAVEFEIYIKGTIKVGSRLKGAGHVLLPHRGGMTIGCSSVNEFLIVLIDKFQAFEYALEFDISLQLNSFTDNQLTFLRMAEVLRSNRKNGTIDENGIVIKWTPLFMSPEIIVKI